MGYDWAEMDLYFVLYAYNIYIYIYIYTSTHMYTYMSDDLSIFHSRYNDVLHAVSSSHLDSEACSESPPAGGSASGPAPQ